MNHVNITLDLFTENTIGQECFNWCQEANFIHQSNLEIQGLFIPALALIVFFIGYILFKYSDHIINFINKGDTDFEINEEGLTNIFKLIYQFGMLLLIGFFMWFLWFK